ncbi:MAG TPA: CPBP family intramembrane glutamic endopeptidase [Anaerolineales bacterium]|nr:CPBP family intramembrane glutamic endopeptidase [Anaerolineales bacterium]
MKKLFSFNLEFNWNIVIATISVTLLIMVDRYHNFTGSTGLDRIILFLGVPLFIIVVLLRESPADYGFRLGDWKAGLAMTGLVILVAAPILYFTAKGDASMHEYYERLLTPRLPGYVFLDLFGWEFMFRGWLLFGYARKYGHDALWLQAVPFALAHIGKPEVETLSTIFGGFLFGLVAWRSKSFLYAFLIHYFVFFFTVLVAGGFFG